MASSTFLELLKQLNTSRLLVLKERVEGEHKFIPIDLSTQNSDLSHVNLESSEDLNNYIQAYLDTAQEDVAYGGYLEERQLYQRSSYFNVDDVAAERNIHLGIDFWCDAGTPVCAILEGEVHSFKNNTNYGDYGPTIILKHRFFRVEFFTLYGHLSLASIANLTVGQKLAGGTVLGTLGDATVNGDYPPHLHFQIIKDIQDYFGDYPGVASKKDLEFYKTNCPDPNVLLRL